METKLKIWKQGQFYPELGKKVITLPYHINPGPSDLQIVIDGFNVQPEKDGNFLNGDYSEDELDAIHTFGIIRMVIDLYDNLVGKPIIWSWNQNGDMTPLKVRIKNNDINARFLSAQKCLELDYYGSNNDLIFNCRTVDLVAHETGHVIINSFFPDWQNGDAETRGLEEAFCDLAAMFLVLSQFDLCGEVIRETKGDLTKNSILSYFGVGHGHDGEIRNAINISTYNASGWNPYSYCEALVGVLYELLQELFKDKREEVSDDAANLFEVGQRWMKGIVVAFLKCNPKKSSLKEFYVQLSGTSSIDHVKIRKHFTKRKIY